MIITKQVEEKLKRIGPGPTECFELGMICWEQFLEHEEGKFMLEFLSTRELRQRALKIFQMAFGIRWEIHPPLGHGMLDMLFTPPLCRKYWDDYVDTRWGEIVLDGEAYPHTPELILNAAEILFINGFVAATIVYGRLK